MNPEQLTALVREAEKYEPCMSVDVSQEGKAVDLILDSSVSFYGEWIKGEGADICLYRCQETDKVVGCRLPLYNSKLAVFHEGALKVNEGFRKDKQ